MAKPLHITPRHGRWAVVHEDSEQPLAQFDAHEEAESWARRYADEDTAVVVHDRAAA